MRAPVVRFDLSAYIRDATSLLDRAHVLATSLCKIHNYFAEADWVYRRFRRLVEQDPPPPNFMPVEWSPISKTELRLLQRCSERLAQANLETLYRKHLLFCLRLLNGWFARVLNCAEVTMNPPRQPD
jgi:hypothetical protein